MNLFRPGCFTSSFFSFWQFFEIKGWLSDTHAYWGQHYQFLNMLSVFQAVVTSNVCSIGVSEQVESSYLGSRRFRELLPPFLCVFNEIVDWFLWLHMLVIVLWSWARTHSKVVNADDCKVLHQPFVHLVIKWCRGSISVQKDENWLILDVFEIKRYRKHIYPCSIWLFTHMNQLLGNELSWDVWKQDHFLL